MTGADVRFWDSSALVPLLASEEATGPVAAAYLQDPEVIAWWSTEVECISAVARREREGSLGPAEVAVSLSRLDQLAAAWQQVEPGAAVKRIAARLVRVHALRVADALQLAAAIVASENEPATLPLVTLDDRLALAAGREGFPVVHPAT